MLGGHVEGSDDPGEAAGAYQPPHSGIFWTFFTSMWSM